ncbi:NRDE family protein [Microbacterium sp.]|jgi:hypothetical protein|uniref:NRDE family protein n=1 Tax=Microbacterium sp. TaxID=51671 RepID=UPI0025E51711|nr:NRDE family protein [Microbacterium sp.]
MCTVVVHVPAEHGRSTRVLAIRDEDPDRPWNPLGRWWPEPHAGVVGVRDVRAGGAWLAADTDARRLAVLMNRADLSTPLPESELVSRGGLVLDSVAGKPPARHPRTHGFNLLEVDPGGTRVHTWNGEHRRTLILEPGTHMIAHDDVDDPATPRIARWLGEFRAASIAEGERWWMPWVEILERSSALESTDDQAIIRDNRPHGYPTLSLLACVASVSDDGIELSYGELTEPGHWGGLDLT